MIDSTAAYREAITATARKTKVRATVNTADPDVLIEHYASTDKLPWSHPSYNVLDKSVELDRFATLERNRWLLDGTFDIFPDDPKEMSLWKFSGWIEEELGNASGVSNFTIMYTGFRYLTELQALTVCFSSDEADGVPDDFDVQIYDSNGKRVYLKHIKGNTESYVQVTGFDFHDIGFITVNTYRNTTPFRRARISQLVLGYFKTWNDDQISDVMIDMTVDPSCVTLPYGTCALTLSNENREFDPRSPNSLYPLLQERQSVSLEIGVDVNGNIDYKPAGMYFQYNNGWKSLNSATVVKWTLVDMIGLLSDREFIYGWPPGPQTLKEWIWKITATLGGQFQLRYDVDPDYADLPLTATAESVAGLKCGDLLRYVCMATGTWPRADAETGYLTIEPLWSQGNQITLDNLEDYPSIQANLEIGQFVFTLADEAQTQCVIAGNNISSARSVSIKNPFISTQEQAAAAAQNMIAHYGGMIYYTTGRGDPSTEVGDVVTLMLDRSDAATGRVVSQTFNYSKQVLSGCETKLVQADGALTYSDRAAVSANGTWTVPAGVTSIRLILVGGGDGGARGTAGSWDAAGEAGADGAGGLVWFGVISVTPGESFSVAIGAGGAANGGAGQATTFGPYSSANGKRYSPAYTDLTEGAAYGRSGVAAPLANTGDGGAGGAAGRKGESHETKYKDLYGFVYTRTVIDVQPGAGGDGAAGGSGCVVIYYNKPE